MAPQRGRGTRFKCPDCGFRDAHAMGLGRHRTARQGVPSQRQLREGKIGDGAVSRAEFAKLRARVAALERDYERLLRSLSAVGRRRQRG
jgi:hypothetical protein